MSNTILNNSKDINNLEFSNEIKVIFSDVDGTIIPLDNDYKVVNIPQSVLIAVQKLNKAEIHLVLTTGRALNEIKNVSSIINSPKINYILLHGAEIYTFDLQLIHKDYISKKQLSEIISSICEFTTKNKTNTNFYFVFNGEQYSTKPFKLPYNGKEVILIESLNDLGNDYEIGKILICERNNEKRIEIQKFLSAKFPELQIELSGDLYCDITNQNATKGSAIKKCQNYLTLIWKILQYLEMLKMIKVCLI